MLAGRSREGLCPELTNGKTRIYENLPILRCKVVVLLSSPSEKGLQGLLRIQMSRKRYVKEAVDGFSLIEVLVVITIGGILLAIAWLRIS